MKANLLNLTRGAVLLLTGATLALAADPFKQPDSYIRVSGYGTSVSGDDSAFKARTQSPNGAGIEALHVSTTTAKDVVIKAEGRALFGSEDYLAKLGFSKDEVGSLEIGYKRFRTFYDGVGGFFPTNGRFLTLTERELHVDRGSFWVGATLARPNLPVFTVHYRNELRNGRKDSTIWGSSSLTGLPYNTAPNPINPTRKIAPSYIDLGERKQEFEFSAKHNLGRTTLELRYLNGEIDNLNTRWVMNSPGQSVPFPTPSGTALALLDPVNWANQLSYTQSDGILSKHQSIQFKSETTLTEQLTFRADGSYQRVRADLSGDRNLVTWTPGATGVTQVLTTSYTGLVGSSRANVYVGSLTLDYKPNDQFFLRLGVRADEEYLSARGDFSVISTTTTTPRIAWSKEDTDSVTPVMEVRYTGFRNLALYAQGNLRSASGEKRNTSAYNPLTAANGTLAINANDENRDQFTVGAVWRPSARFTGRAELYRKVTSIEAAGFETRAGDFFKIDSDLLGLKLTGTVNPIETVTLTARYIRQEGDMQTTGYQPTFAKYDSADAENHSIGGTLNWNPTAQVYVQLNGSLIFNVLRTAYPRIGVVAPTSTNNGYDANKILQDAVNDYLTGSIVCGWVLNASTDANLQFTYYKADNGNAAVAAWTMPYGVAERDYTIVAGVKHKLSDKVVVNARLGYIDSQSNSRGGRTDFKGPLAYLSFDYAL